MPSTRSKLILDEDSFQGLLAAAFTIQQYNDREGGIDAALSAELNAVIGSASVKEDSGTKSTDLCADNLGKGVPPASVEHTPEWTVPLPAKGVPGQVLDADTLRPGERLQRTWATMWSMSQEQGAISKGSLSPSQSSPDAPPGSQSDTPDMASLFTESNGGATEDLAVRKAQGEGSRILPANSTAAVPHSIVLPFGLRFRRADLYLGLAVLVALVALLWPAASAGRSGTGH